MTTVGLVSRNLAGLAIAVPLLCGTARAEVEWTRPDVDPYRGALDYAVVEMVGAGAAIPTNWALGRCLVRPIVDGERFEYMMSGHRGVLRDVIARTGEWPASIPRSAVDCTVATAPSEASGVEVEGHLVRPDACGNWAWEEGGTAPPRAAGSLPGPTGWSGPAWYGAPSWGSAAFVLPPTFLLPPSRVPEPSTLALLATAAVGLLLSRWYRAHVLTERVDR